MQGEPGIVDSKTESTQAEGSFLSMVIKTPGVNARRETRGKKYMRKVVEGAAVWLAIAASSVPAMAWEPTKPVEIVVAAGAGGASDQMARMMQAAIQKNNLMKQPMVVSLKGGASGAEALM